eukprot:TRINITY_DN11172_c0_g1_i1.p1 TRINITY_DN11172_c0_g1~~TRINITY_DN11172_c0_g1_i1.p1  ORF type:complete len:523 (+),score=69.22 TRINITY_DN11172_c0_g1_i1:132-1700(+)
MQGQVHNLVYQLTVKPPGWNKITDDDADYILRLIEDNAKSQLYRSFLPLIAPDLRKFNDQVGLVSKTPDGRYTIQFPPIPTSNSTTPILDDSAISELCSQFSSVPTVKWAKMFSYMDTPCFTVFMNVEISDCVLSVVNNWRASPLNYLKLILLDSDKSYTPQSPKFPEEDKRKALVWWKNNQAATIKLFDEHSNLNGIFMDFPLRKGKFNEKEISVVFVVDQKYFIPKNEKSLPSYFNGLPTDVRSGQIELCGAHVNAINLSEKLAYIGMSIGTPDSTTSMPEAGTLGIMLNSTSGRKYGLTAQHVLTHSLTRVPDPNEIISGPALGDQPIPQEIARLNYCYGIYGHSEVHHAFNVTLDVALLESPHDLLPRTTLVAPNNIEQYMNQDKVIDLQELLQIDNLPLAFFGRSSGAEGIYPNEHLELFQVGLAHIKPTLKIHRRAEVVLEKGELFANQLIFWGGGREVVEKGDSGSGLFSVSGDRLSPVGLVTAKMCYYGFATPLSAILQHLENQGYALSLLIPN